MNQNIIHSLSKSDNFFLLAGPCVIEGEKMALDIAEQIVKTTDRLNIPYIFKGSYRKANRSRLDSFTGIGDIEALKILAKVRETFGCPVVTDIHSPAEADMAAEFVDVLQIPAFLCRQTDLLVAAARTGKTVNIKKNTKVKKTVKVKGKGRAKYYVRIRSYKIIDGKKHYGKFGYKKAVRIK